MLIWATWAKTCILRAVDGEEEYIIYTETVGTIRAEDKDAEKDFYKFVEEAGW